MSDATAAQPAPPAQKTDDAPDAAAERLPVSPTAADAKPAADGAKEDATPASDARDAAEKETAQDKESDDKAGDVDAEMKEDAKPEDVTETDDAEKSDDATVVGKAKDAVAAVVDAAAEVVDKVTQAPATPAAGDKNKSRRKSTASQSETKKKLNKKASRTRITHIDAKPGDHFFIKLKGYPRWPGIICSEDMLPQSLLKTRPVTAAKADGTYRDDFADGGKQVHNRTFPVMYLATNEFGWIPNTDLEDLDPTTVADLVTPKMRKDLQAAHELAAENNDLEYYKDVLLKHQEHLMEEKNEQRAREEAAAAKAAASSASKKSKKASSKENPDEDTEMADAYDAEVPASEKKTSKKRKAEDGAATPQRSESVKKPKIKLTTNSTPKAANGDSTATQSKAASESKPKSSNRKKSLATQEAGEKKSAKEEAVVVPQEPELSPEERHARKEKEVLFLRHKLQKGLLTRDQEPKESEMKAMSDFVDKLENFPELEVSIIRATKINKVLKAILKLDNIPKEEEFKFRPRSQALLDKWNKLLASEGTGGAANGVNGTSKKAAASAAAAAPTTSEAKEPAETKGAKTDAAGSNGVKENGEGADGSLAAAKTEEATKGEEEQADKEMTDGQNDDKKPADDAEVAA